MPYIKDMVNVRFQFKSHDVLQCSATTGPRPGTGPLEDRYRAALHFHVCSAIRLSYYVTKNVLEIYVS